MAAIERTAYPRSPPRRSRLLNLQRLYAPTEEEWALSPPMPEDRPSI